MTLTSIRVINRTSAPTLTITYGTSNYTSLNTNHAPDSFTYSTGDITVSDGTNTYTILGSGLSTIPHASMNINFFDKITVNDPVSSSLMYDSQGSNPVSSYNGYSGLMLSTSDKIALTNFNSGVWVVDTYSNYVQTLVLGMPASHWFIILVILLVIVFAIIGGVYFYKRRKNKMQ